jgi:allantoinase
MTNPRVPFQAANDRTPLAPPDGKPLIVHVVMNIEHWPFEQPMPRSLIQKPHGKSAGPDVSNYCWAEYGLRCGLPRMIEAFAARELPVTAAINSSIIDAYPTLAATVRDASWAFMGHGVIQRSLEHEDDEVAVIAAALHAVSTFTGQPVRSWLGPGFGETDDTPEHLAAAGIEFLFDWCLDDLPSWLRTTHGPILAMPYALELNDVTLFALEKQSSPDYLERFTDTVRILEPELARQPRVLTIALHPHIMGVPHRLDYLLRTIDMLQARDDTVFMTCDAIGDWFTDADISDDRTKVA